MLITKRDSNNFPLIGSGGYSYNHGGLLTSETYPTNRTVTYSYDGGARLSQVSDGTTNFTSGLTYAKQDHDGL
jgi:YD repeat-containing protein